MTFLYKLGLSLSRSCLFSVRDYCRGGRAKRFSAWSLIQDSAQLGSPSCWEAGGWQENLLAECLRLFVLALNPLYTSSHANTSSHQQLWDTRGFVKLLNIVLLQFFLCVGLLFFPFVIYVVVMEGVPVKTTLTKGSIQFTQEYNRNYTDGIQLL